jgi:hypothetical protein
VDTLEVFESRVRGDANDRSLEALVTFTETHRTS